MSGQAGLAVSLRPAARRTGAVPHKFGSVESTLPFARSALPAEMGRTARSQSLCERQLLARPQHLSAVLLGLPGMDASQKVHEGGGKWVHKALVHRLDDALPRRDSQPAQHLSRPKGAQKPSVNPGPLLSRNDTLTQLPS